MQLQQGKLQGQQRLTRKLGSIPAKHEKAIRDLPLQVVEALGEALLDFRSKADLTRWLKSRSV